VEAIYKKAITAGAIGGAVVVLLLIVQSVASLVYLNGVVTRYGYNYATQESSSIGLLVTLSGYFLYFVNAVLFLIVGALAVRAAAPALKQFEDAMVVAAISGMAMAIVYSLANVLIGVIMGYVTMNILMPYTTDTYADNGIRTGIPLIGSAIEGCTDLCCCLPVILLFGTALALVGGLGYWMLILSNRPAAPETYQYAP